MSLPLSHATLAWTFHAKHPDDPPNLPAWSSTLHAFYDGVVQQRLPAHGFPVDATHVNWAVALATVSNGFPGRAQVDEACRYMRQAGVGGSPFAPDAVPGVFMDAVVPGTGTATRSFAGASARTPVADGRYLGGNHEVAIELRVDHSGCGVLSGDLFRLLGGTRHYVASFRTAPGLRTDAAASDWPLVAQDEADRRVQGRLFLERQDDPPDSVNGRLFFEGQLEGLPSRRAVPFVAERASSAFRTLGLEIETEIGVTPIGAYTANGREVTIESALADAGLEPFVTGLPTPIPAVPAGGWEMAHLHTLMSDLADASLARRAWEVHLLVMSRSDRSGLLGVMFDSTDALPRQGAAIFASEIRQIAGQDAARKLVQTTVHEIGHALNLAHRFERVVGRADSTSFMNYDWRYRGGNRRTEFWNGFQFTFDGDELEFLRHAPLPPLIPGGAAFHSIAYWADGNGGYSPYVPEAPLTGFAMALKPPVDPPLFGFAQPVVMEVALTNNSGSAITVPSFLLDPKAGFIEIVVRRVHSGVFSPGSGQALSFVPAMQRCFEFDAADSVTLDDGATIADNVNLTFGSGGFAFAEPGSYEVTALLVLFDSQSQRELIARSNTVRVRIAGPKTDADERDGMAFFRDDVGMYLALGGSPALSKARATLQEIVGRRKQDLADPLVAHAVRAMAIEDSREYTRFSRGRFRTEAAHADLAGEAFDRLAKSGMKAFDDSTRLRTSELANRVHQMRQGKSVKAGPVAPRVYGGRNDPDIEPPRRPRKRR